MLWRKNKIKNKEKCKTRFYNKNGAGKNLSKETTEKGNNQ